MVRSRSGGPAGISPQEAEKLIVAATMAPSVHDTQPWRFRIRRDVVELYADRGRSLPAGDPRGHALTVSCGAALLNLRLAAVHLGREPVVRLLPDPDQPLLLATVRLGGRHRPTEAEEALFAVIRRRCTDRSPFGDERLPSAVVPELADAARIEGATLRILEADEVREALELTAEAERATVCDATRREEIARWATRAPAERGRMPEHAVGPLPAGGTPPIWDLGLGRDTDDRPVMTFEKASQLAILCTSGDAAYDWLRAGQALQRVMLGGTLRSVAVSFLQQAIEVDECRTRLRRLAGRDGHVQMLLRIGYGLPVGRTPRRPITEVLDWAE